MSDPDVVVIDYDAGNLRSVSKALELLGYVPNVTSDPRVVERAQAIILPGVGPAGAMNTLHRMGLVGPLKEAVAKGVPFMGVCLGLQLLFDWSEEGDINCLGIIEGKTRLLQPRLKVPHMGWNQVKRVKDHPIFNGVSTESYFYFVHSYFPEPANPYDIIGETEYGITFASAIGRDNIVGVQFHPEKSGPDGLKLYDNFMKLMVLRR
jgi:glutamine amidotransferase